MDCRDVGDAIGVAHRLAAVDGHTKRWTQQRSRGCRPEADDDVGLNGRDLGIEPRPARANLAGAGLRVDALLAFRHPLEVLDGVRDVHTRPIDTSGLERAIEQTAGRTHEWLAGKVLVVSRLL